MTQDSCLAAAVGIINAAALGYVTVAAVDDLKLRIQPADAPAALLRAGQSRETRISGGVPGFRLSRWPLDCEVRRYDPDRTTGPGFRQLVETTAGLFRHNFRLAGNADTAGTSVLFAATSAVRVLPERAPYAGTGTGQVLRTGRFRVEIMEEVRVT